MKKIGLFFILIVTIIQVSTLKTEGQIVNKTIQLIEEANNDIQNGNYEQAVQRLIASIQENSNIREAYQALYTACSYTNQNSIIKSYLQKAKTVFEGDDEFCYYLGNIYQNEKNYAKAIQEYTLAIKYSKINGEDFELVYAYYYNRANCYLKNNEFEKAIIDYTSSIKLNEDNGNIYVNRGIAYYQIGKRKEACQDWKKASALGIATAKIYLRKYCR